MGHLYGFKKGFAVGVVLGAAGAFVLSQKRRAIMGGIWKLKARADIHRRLGELKRLTRENYDSVVDDALERYRTAGSIAKYEIDEFSRDLKRRWKEVKQEFEEAAEELDDEEE